MTESSNSEHFHSQREISKQAVLTRLATMRSQSFSWKSCSFRPNSGLRRRQLCTMTDSHSAVAKSAEATHQKHRSKPQGHQILLSTSPNLRLRAGKAAAERQVMSHRDGVPISHSWYRDCIPKIITGTTGSENTGSLEAASSVVRWLEMEAEVFSGKPTHWRMKGFYRSCNIKRRHLCYCNCHHRRSSP